VRLLLNLAEKVPSKLHLSQAYSGNVHRPNRTAEYLHFLRHAQLTLVPLVLGAVLNLDSSDMNPLLGRRTERTWVFEELGSESHVYTGIAPTGVRVFQN
jgi:hypothetical protein